MISHRDRLWKILSLPPAEFQIAEAQCHNGVITAHNFFTKTINAWKSQTNGSLMDLCDILKQNGFQLSAGKYVKY
jgi:hypothetical protein